MKLIYVLPFFELTFVFKGRTTPASKELADLGNRKICGDLLSYRRGACNQALYVADH